MIDMMMSDMVISFLMKQKRDTMPQRGTMPPVGWVLLRVLLWRLRVFCLFGLVSRQYQIRAISYGVDVRKIAQRLVVVKWLAKLSEYRPNLNGIPRI